ncbi:calpain-like cysteine peptidase [Trypanosoma theileri]|uniref:Calpain-like cysteine peptidase n=1 Tax=Trypanosoma theileri TaxID=67003 RepID=A0A1X0NW85_9TRYP|nr:calpain-like cysteine peptidase [Trypanosoma theileri]ORC88964.1 calpain-like cysteine peptidase [Trypanosoma theileri]
MSAKVDTNCFDEFNEANVQPLPEVQKKSNGPWRGCGPTYEGEVTPCFDGGHLFRVINQEEKKWALYNDTTTFEMNVTFTFGKDSKLTALDNTKIKPNQDGEFVATTVVCPLETTMFVSGTWNGYKSRFEGKPLSREYLEKVSSANVESVKKAINEVSQVCASQDPEEVLKECIARNVPFVDPSFPPTDKSLDAGKGVMISLPWLRPSEYLPKELVDYVALFRNPITPSSLEQGELSDSWVMSATSILAEKPDQVKNIFRHPTDSKQTTKESSVGAYRALINRDGMWKSYVVDDFLPVVAGKPRFARSRTDPCELWVSILEKAYAKRNGGFVNIASGDPLLALRDLTGWPTSRLDAAFSEAKSNPDKSNEFFTRLLMLCNAGHTILFSTSGANDEKTRMNMYKEAGITIGYALPVLNLQYVNGFGLFRFRNPWSNGVQWKGNWSPSSHLWEANPDVAAECTNRDGSEDSLWMDWADVKEYFVGCGVLFNYPSSFDYRIPGSFTRVVPNVCLEISVTSPVVLALILSQPDHRGTDKESKEYDPILLNLACSEDGGHQFNVVANTSADAEVPSSDYVFLHGRDVSMIYEFTPEQSPYLVVPRRMNVAESGGVTLPFTLGVLSPVAVTEGGPVRVSFKSLPEDTDVFENYPQFAVKSEPVEVTYQTKDNNSHLDYKTAVEIL